MIKMIEIVKDSTNKINKTKKFYNWQNTVDNSKLLKSDVLFGLVKKFSNAISRQLFYNSSLQSSSQYKLRDNFFELLYCILFPILTGKKNSSTNKAFQTIEFPKNIFVGTLDPLHLGHVEAIQIAEYFFKDKVAIVIIENKAKKEKNFSFPERFEIAKSYLPNAEIFIAQDDKELQEFWSNAKHVVRKFRGNFDKEEDKKTCKLHGVSFDKIKYFELIKYKEVSSMKIKVFLTINKDEVIPFGINKFTYNMLKKQKCISE